LDCKTNQQRIVKRTIQEMELQMLKRWGSLLNSSLKNNYQNPAYWVTYMRESFIKTSNQIGLDFLAT